MKKSCFFWFWSFASCLLIPYFAVIAFFDPAAAMVNRRPDVEKCLPFFLSREISGEYEEETLKAQAVVLRTNVYKKTEDGDNLYEILKKYGKREGKIQECFQKAVDNTENQVLCQEGKVKMVPFHKISAGKTRAGEEVFRDKEYEYLVSVDSSMDVNAEDYSNTVWIGKEQLPERIEVIERDSAGYVQSVMADDELLGGEFLREEWKLPSSHFTLEEKNGKYCFCSEGKGHGVGLSQYGANELAKEGKDHREILAYYFPKMELKNIHKLSGADE